MATAEHWHSPTVLSDQEMLRMQRDAEQRVRRMQRQANETIRQASGTGFPASLPPPNPVLSPGPSSRNLPPPPPPKEQQDPLGLQSLFQDRDRMLILALLFLLKIDNKGDLPLLLALGYLLL